MKTHKGYILIRTGAISEVGGLRFRRGWIVEDAPYSIHRDGKYYKNYVVTDLPTGYHIKTYSKLKDARKAIENGEIQKQMYDYKREHLEDYQNKVTELVNLIDAYKKDILKNEYDKFLKFEDINEKYIQ